ncbi:MAG: nucleoside hydrolase [Cryobacterium sp.]|nr:nucleoside hydrolase [Cryobacterium sp.]
MATATPVLVDCDTGVDDAIALLYLLAHPEVDVVGITSVFGNNTARTCALNTLRVLELAGREDIPVAVGSENPLVGEVTYLATHVHGGDGLGDTGIPPADESALSPLSATALISQLAQQFEGQLRILAVGPLTNIARAMDADPAIVSRVRDIVFMGGAADVAGNQSAAAEANIIHDPEAARAVLSAGWKATMVPLDVTMTEILTDDDRAALVAANTPVSTFVAAITDLYFDGYGADSFGHRCSPCHDALAAAILTGEVVPEVMPLLHVEVDCTDGPGRGATIADTRGRWKGFPDQSGGNCRVALKTDGSFPAKLLARLGA